MEPIALTVLGMYTVWSLVNLSNARAGMVSQLNSYL